MERAQQQMERTTTNACNTDPEGLSNASSGQLLPGKKKYPLKGGFVQSYQASLEKSTIRTSVPGSNDRLIANILRTCSK
jgi:hypothetical protein